MKKKILSNQNIPQQSNAYFLSSVRRNANDVTLRKYPPQTTLVAFVNILQPIIQKCIDSNMDNTVCLNTLLSVQGYGKFIAYQIWVDWSYIKEVPFDDDSLVVSGPGCDEGIDWMLAGEDLTQYIFKNGNDEIKVSYDKLRQHHKLASDGYEEFIIWFKFNLDKLMKDANLDWDPKEFLHFLPEHQQVWTLMDIENSFCELNKLMKIKNNVKFRFRYYHE